MCVNACVCTCVLVCACVIVVCVSGVLSKKRAASHFQLVIMGLAKIV